jgi:hypothetical protein
MESTELTWPKLASRLMRVAMTRADVAYVPLARMLIDAGFDETERSIEAKILRGKAPFAMFVATLCVTDSELPPTWEKPVAEGSTWEQKAANVVLAEISRVPGAKPSELVRRLSQFGIRMTETQLEEDMVGGTLSVIEFLALCAALGTRTLDRYLDARAFMSSALLDTP